MSHVDLVEFLNARLAEDEAAARHATAGPWTNRVGHIMGGSEDRFVICTQAQAWNAGHITRHDPARVLVDVAAKRRIIAEYVDYRDSNDHGDMLLIGEESGLRTAVEMLAQMYRDHSDYREEWRV